MDLQLLERQPERLDEVFRSTLIATLSPDDLERLTPARLKLLAKIAAAKRPRNLTQLAKALRRDKKNISQDLKVLAALGLVEVQRSGRDTLPQAMGREVHIILDEGVEA